MTRASGNTSRGKEGLTGLHLYAVGYLVFLYLPVLFLPLFSFNDGTIVAFPIKGLTLRWYAGLADAGGLTGALANSLVVAASAALISTAVGVFAAKAFANHRFPGAAPAEGLVMLPLVIPGIIVASSMLVLFISVGIRPSLAAVVIGHVFLALPFSVLILKSSFDRFDRSLEEAACDLGETPAAVFRRVTLPLVTPGIVASLLVTFTVSFDEFVLAFFLAGSEPTLPVYIWSQIRFPAKLPYTLALGSILIGCSVLLLFVAELFRRRSAGAGAPA